MPFGLPKHFTGQIRTETSMYQEARKGWAVAVPQRGQWAVYTYVEFDDETHVGFVRTFIHKHVAEYAAKVITTAMNRTDLRAGVAVDY